MPPENPAWYKRSVYVLMLLAFVVRLVYMLYTHRVWEDALITVQHSEDFVRGMGLTHPQPPGEGPLHGFTSPLSVLIPLLGDLMHVGFGVTFLKIVSLFGGMASVWLGTRIARAIGLSHIVALTAGAFLAFEHHQILWGMAGMETQVVTVCYLFALYSMLLGSPWQMGIAAGLCMLARPDAVFLVAIIFVVALFRAWKEKRWQLVAPVAAGLALLYGPWLLFTTLYYGSPIPNTIRAKESYGGFHLLLTSIPLLSLRQRFLAIFHSLGPAYSGNGSFMPMWDNYVIGKCMAVLMVLGFLVALVRRNRPALIVFAFVLTYALYLDLAVPFVFGWYTVPIAAGGILGCMYGAQFLFDLLPQGTPRRIAPAAFAVVYLLLIVTALPYTFHSDKYVQKDIETGLRKPIGQYIATHSLPNDTVGSESLGYVGYYSGKVVYDYPGLCNRDVVAYLHTHPDKRGLVLMLEHFKPTYMVLRQQEWSYLPGGADWHNQWFGNDYDLVKVFSADADDVKKNIIHSEVNIDKTFYLFRRKDAADRDRLGS